jgi:hypothetical protein
VIIRHSDLRRGESAVPIAAGKWHWMPQRDAETGQAIVLIALRLTTDPLLKWQQGEGMLFATIRSFKGLEADAVLMVDVVAPGSLPHFSQADFYVGCSRVKHMLAILGMAPGVV